MLTFGDVLVDFIHDPLGVSLIFGSFIGVLLALGVLFDKEWNCSTITKILVVIGVILLIHFTNSYFEEKNAAQPDYMDRPCWWAEGDEYDDCIDSLTGY